MLNIELSRKMLQRAATLCRLNNWGKPSRALVDTTSSKAQWHGSTVKTLAVWVSLTTWVWSLVACICIPALVWREERQRDGRIIWSFQVRQSGVYSKQKEKVTLPQKPRWKERTNFRKLSLTSTYTMAGIFLYYHQEPKYCVERGCRILMVTQ